jgi:phosphoribosylanthranilate isomerase
MTRSGFTRIKICCIASIEEAWMAIRHGASAVGLISEMPSGPGVISEDRITEITAALPPAVGSFLLTSKQDVPEIISQQRSCRTNTVQLCNPLRTGTLEELAAFLPGVSIVQVIHVTGEKSVEEARAVAGDVDGILLDSRIDGTPCGAPQLGGTGETHDWAISRRIVEDVDVPVFLAGGLRPDNVAEAIRTVRPFGVDVCTGVRTEGNLDESKLRSFIEAVRTTHT